MAMSDMSVTGRPPGPVHRRPYSSWPWNVLAIVLWSVLVVSSVAGLLIGWSYVVSLFETTGPDGHKITNEERGMSLAVTLVFGGAALAGVVATAVPLWLLGRAARRS
jgi:hypothetical protein